MNQYNENGQLGKQTGRKAKDRKEVGCWVGRQ